MYQQDLVRLVVLSHSLSCVHLPGNRRNWRAEKSGIGVARVEGMLACSQNCRVILLDFLAYPRERERERESWRTAPLIARLRLPSDTSSSVNLFVGSSVASASWQRCVCQDGNRSWEKSLCLYIVPLAVSMSAVGVTISPLMDQQVMLLSKGTCKYINNVRRTSAKVFAKELGFH